MTQNGLLILADKAVDTNPLRAVLMSDEAGARFQGSATRMSKVRNLRRITWINVPGGR